jgi:hypothetical protein
MNKTHTPIIVWLLFMCAVHLWKYSFRFSENNFIQNYDFCHTYSKFIIHLPSIF